MMEVYVCEIQRRGCECISEIAGVCVYVSAYEQVRVKSVSMVSVNVRV